ncbi:MAG: hypothetical protein EP335_11765 [Alphaproteobacteria bacterium]|nr:MAG: hypothetical protein EP335_11765 [Alphaproteobacteria bacterium]
MGRSAIKFALLVLRCAAIVVVAIVAGARNASDGTAWWDWTYAGWFSLAVYLLVLPAYFCWRNHGGFTLLRSLLLFGLGFGLLSSLYFLFALAQMGGGFSADLLLDTGPIGLGFVVYGSVGGFVFWVTGLPFRKLFPGHPAL